MAVRLITQPKAIASFHIFAPCLHVMLASSGWSRLSPQTPFHRPR